VVPKKRHGTTVNTRPVVRPPSPVKRSHRNDYGQIDDDGPSFSSHFEAEESLPAGKRKRGKVTRTYISWLQIVLDLPTIRRLMTK
jgi:hypothetical protein